jgi:hypothetical protein
MSEIHAQWHPDPATLDFEIHLSVQLENSPRKRMVKALEKVVYSSSAS